MAENQRSGPGVIASSKSLTERRLPAKPGYSISGTSGLLFDLSSDRMTEFDDVVGFSENNLFI